MLNAIAKSVIVKALRIRKAWGEEPTEVLETYHSLTDAEKEEILAETE